MIPHRLKKGIAYLESLGYKVKLGSYVVNTYGYLAGKDAQRAEDFNRMFYDNEVDVVFCTRGGYGSPRLLSKIDYHRIKQNPKIFVGYSDITALQLALFAKTGLVTFSGPMVAVEMAKGIDSFTEKHFWELLTGVPTAFRFSHQDKPLQCFKKGQTKGRLLGGCLSLICSLLGTPFLPDFQDAILFLEDVGEEPYQIDRNLSQLRLAGVLNQINGLVVGTFEKGPSENENPSLTLDQVLGDMVGDLDIPVATGLPYGHIDVKCTIPIGVDAFLNADDGYLEILATPVV